MAGQGAMGGTRMPAPHTACSPRLTMPGLPACPHPSSPRMLALPVVCRADTLSRVRGEVGELKNIMVDNIEKVWWVGENKRAYMPARLPARLPATQPPCAAHPQELLQHLYLPACPPVCACARRRCWGAASGWSCWWRRQTHWGSRHSPSSGRCAMHACGCSKLSHNCPTFCCAVQ